MNVIEVKLSSRPFFLKIPNLNVLFLAFLLFGCKDSMNWVRFKNFTLKIGQLLVPDESLACLIHANLQLYSVLFFLFISPHPSDTTNKSMQVLYKYQDITMENNILLAEVINPV